MVLDELANVIAVLAGHDYVGDHNGRLRALDLDQRRLRVVAGDHVNVLAAEGDLDHLAHGCAVVNEINSRGRAPSRPPSGVVRAPSSSSGIAFSPPSWLASSKLLMCAAITSGPRRLST